MTNAIDKANGQGDAQAIELALVSGDLAKLTPAQRLSYYRQVCDSLGLNPLTRPFDYITLNNKLALYARKDCTEQLRKNQVVSVAIVGRELVEDCYIVTARATMPSGRQDESIGAVSIHGLKGEARANAMMKAETKAKRRVTLSICGLGMLDETEVETTPNAYPPEMSVEGNSLSPEEQAEAKRKNPQPPPTRYATDEQYEIAESLGRELGLDKHQRFRITCGRLGVKRFGNLTYEQAVGIILDYQREVVAALLTKHGVNLDDVRNVAPDVAADTPDQLTAEHAPVALAVLRAWPENAPVPA